MLVETFRCKSTLALCGLLFVPLVQTAERGEGFGHRVELGHSTDPVTDQRGIEEQYYAAEEALRLEHAQQAKGLQKHLTQDLDLLVPSFKQGDAEGVLRSTVRDTTMDDNLTVEEREALKAIKHHNLNATTSTNSEHLTNYHTPLNLIRTKIIQHLANEFTAIKETLTAEQIKNREMVIKFFDKAGELTEENLKKFRNVYEKLAEWKEGTELTLTIDEQKEMKLFLQSIISTYCTNHRSEA